MGKKKEIAKWDKLISKFQKNRDCIKITRMLEAGEDNIQGVILNHSEEFLQIASTNEFAFNGEIIIRQDQFEAIRFNEYDLTYKQVLISEKELTKKSPKPTKLSLSSWRTILKGLKKKDIHVIIDCENLKNPTFTIGPIVKVNDKNVELRYYDPTGQLEKKTTKVKYKDITSITYNDKYSTTFRKYLKGADKKK